MVIFLTIAAPAIGQASKNDKKSAENSLHQFKWLLGKWERQNLPSGKSAFEIWRWHADSTMMGTGFTLQNSDTVFVEKLRLMAHPEGIFYVADVAHNKAPVYFRITEVFPQGFIAENPEHDFPKRIRYEVSGDQLKAETSGDGHANFFLFKKVY